MLIQFDIVSVSFCVISKKNDGKIQSWLNMIGATLGVSYIYIQVIVKSKQCWYLSLFKKLFQTCMTVSFVEHKRFFFYSGHFFKVMKINEGSTEAPKTT